MRLPCGEAARRSASRPRGGRLFGATAQLATLDATKPNYIAPQVAMDDEGNAFAMWAAGVPSVGSPRFSVQGAALDASGPSERSLYIPTTGRPNETLGMIADPVDRWSAVASSSWDF